MNSRFRIPLVSLTILLFAALACGAGGGSESPATAAAGTVSAILTASAAAPIAGAPTSPPAGVPPTLEPGQPTQAMAEVKPTDTAAPTNTPGVAGCADGAQYVADVTVPDNTVFAPGTAFTKTWRLRNSGTCNWAGAYSLAFVGGNALGGPASVAVVGNVPPGSLYDVSVNMVAPTTPGTHKGAWQMRNGSGAFFGTQPFVQIIVAAPTAPNTIAPTATQTNTSAPATATPTVTLTPTPTNTVGPTTITITAGGGTGGVYSPPPTVFGAPNAGDDASNASRQGFVTFSLAAIPASATITAVKLDLTPFDQLGNAFSLGCLRVYQQNYGALDAGDFFSGSPLGALWRFCSATDISDATAQTSDPSGVGLVQSSLASGQFQIRLQFNENATNGNGADDLLRPTPKLIVTYNP